MPLAPKPVVAEPLDFATPRAFEAWLREHHARIDDAWLQIARVGADRPGLTYAQAVDVALCWGWIDGQKKPLDERHWLQRFTPRRARSLWSKINRAKAETLVEAGCMQPAGQAEIDRAKSDGQSSSPP